MAIMQWGLILGCTATLAFAQTSSFGQSASESVFHEIGTPLGWDLGLGTRTVRGNHQKTTREERSEKARMTRAFAQR
jgi:hypothetical protein